MEHSERTVALDRRIYLPECLPQAIEEFREFCTVTVQDGSDGVRLTITRLPDAPENSADEFLNFVLMASLDRHLS